MAGEGDEGSAGGGRRAGDGESDPLYDQAVEVVLKNRRASISLVQRHLRIGYNRAARLLEQMEQAGLVSAMSSNGNREILDARARTPNKRVHPWRTNICSKSGSARMHRSNAGRRVDAARVAGFASGTEQLKTFVSQVHAARGTSCSRK